MLAAAVVAAVRHIVPIAAVAAAALARTVIMYPDDDDGDDHHDPESLAAVEEEPSAIVAASAVTVVVATHKKLPPKKNSHSRVFRSPLKCSGFLVSRCFCLPFISQPLHNTILCPPLRLATGLLVLFSLWEKKNRACHKANPVLKLADGITQKLSRSSPVRIP